MKKIIAILLVFILCLSLCVFHAGAFTGGGTTDQTACYPSF